VTETAKPPAERNRAVVQSVARSLDLLEALGSGEDFGLVELATRTGLQPSTAHRLLATLIERGYVIRDGTGSRYRLGHEVLRLAGHVQRSTSRLRAVARAHLEAMRRESEETANLLVLEDDAVVYIDQVESPRAVRMSARTGLRVPAHATASGKAMLAFQVDGPLVASLLARRDGLPRLTPHTITSPHDLEEEMARIRRRGWAVDDEEYEEGTMCVAAPVFDHTDIPRIALSISGPAARIRRVEAAALGDLVVAHAREMSAELGYEPQAEAGAGD
jgi:IclR family acetate operon transcriptional repressor